MKIRKFYKKHMDIFELSRAYLGTIILCLVGCYYSHGMPGIFGEQVYQVLNACVSGNPMCPI